MSVEVQHDADTHTKATLTISVEPAEIASAKDKAFGQYTRTPCAESKFARYAALSSA